MRFSWMIGSVPSTISATPLLGEPEVDFLHPPTPPLTRLRITEIRMDMELDRIRIEMQKGRTVVVLGLRRFLGF